MLEIPYGVWGCGGHAVDAHCVHNKEVPKMILAGVCDTNASAMKRYCQNYGSDVPRFKNHYDLLRSGIKAVLIATPDRFHPDHLREALVAGLHVMIEKPLAIDKRGYFEIVEGLRYARTRNLVVTSCHPRRFDPPFVWLKNSLPSLTDRLGPVLGFHYDFVYHKPSMGWKTRRSLMLDHAGHEIDLVSFLFGRIPFSAESHDDSFDRYLVTGQRKDGIRFSFHGTRRMEERVFLEWMTVRFEFGSVTVNTETGIATVENTRSNKISQRKCGATDYRIRSVGVIRNFADTITGAKPNYLTPEDLELNNSLGIWLRENGSYTYSG
ncbi:MAG: Gfo/Idh/MocA family oxidoreductase [Candidatus Moranbacteria bacterium]|nr:Gfo/Idh/MocA family oxidoreductase [Candidatus Moranbacteria bacterium]